MSLGAQHEDPHGVPEQPDPYPQLIDQLASFEKQPGSRKTVGCEGAEGSGPAVPMTLEIQPKLQLVGAP